MQQAARVADRTAFFSLESTQRCQVGRDADRVRRHRGDLQPAADPRTRDYVTGRFG
jgi:ABC-type phosphate transport system ATPase subunit